MKPVRPTPSLASMLFAASCAGSRTGPPPTLSSTLVEEPVTAVITAAFAADYQRIPADSLWDPDATVVADGEVRTAPPRFAGVGSGGGVAITSSRLELRQGLAWVYLEYRWSELNAGLAREGRATVLLVPGKGGRGWTIVHAHSSTERQAPPR